MRTKMPGAAFVALLASLTFAVSATAAGAGTLTLAQTYPVASALCAKASAGTLGKRLEPQQSAVEAACTTLTNDFGPLVTTVAAAQTQYEQTVADNAAAVAKACPTPITAAQWPACRVARAQARLSNLQARVTRLSAVEAYRSAIETNRLAFWSTIASLRGGSTTTTTS